MKPMFSIIVPIYNVEKYLKKCVDSILNQTNKNFELILVDDGSPDNCPNICDEYKQKYVNIKVVHKKNGGLVSARKAGSNIAVGKYILNVDGDDWIKDDYLEKIEYVIKKYNPDIVCFGAILSWKNLTKEYTLPYEKGFYDKRKIISKIYPVLIEAKNGEYFPPSVWSKAVKRELYIKYQMKVDNHISIGEDGACTKPIIYEANSMYIMEDSLYYYRQNEGSMTKNRKAFSMVAPLLIARCFEESIEFEGMQGQIYRNFTHNLFNAVVSQFYREEDIKKIIEDIEQILHQEYVRNAVKESKYNLLYWRGNLAKISLMWKMYWLIRLYSKIRVL